MRNYELRIMSDECYAGLNVGRIGVSGNHTIGEPDGGRMFYVKQSDFLHHHHGCMGHSNECVSSS